MKKVTLLAMSALVALGASAQYTCNPVVGEVVSQNPKTVEYLTLSDEAVATLTAAGAKCTYIGPSPDEGRNLWYWEDTFIAGDDSYPRVGQDEGGYVSVEVGTVGWSGAGFSCSTAEIKTGIDISMFNDETRFHFAYMTPNGNAPASIAVIICDEGETGNLPAKFAVGTAFVDGAATYPTVGPKASDDWQGIDISFADLKKIYPAFAYKPVTNFGGNIMSFLGGGVTGTTLAFDAVYFYNTGEAGIADAQVEVDFIVTDNTVNVNNGNGIVLYNLAGQVVKSTEGCVLGINNVQGGVYIARSGNKAQKVVVR